MLRASVLPSAMLAGNPIDQTVLISNGTVIG